MPAQGTLFGYAVDSVFALRRLSGADPVRGTIGVDRCSTVVQDPDSVIHDDGTSGARLTIAREPDGSLAVVCSITGGFRLDPPSARVLADRRCDDDDLWEHRLVTVMVPLLLAERGDMALHAATVARGGVAVAFAGASARGKSTLAWAAHAAALDVLADDGSVIEAAEETGIAWPGPTGIRVALPGSVRKGTLTTEGRPTGPSRLAAVVLLGPRAGEAPSLSPVTPVEAVPALVPSLVFSGPDRLAQAMRSAAWLAARVPVLRCRMPDGVERLPEALATVLDQVTRQGA